MKKLIRKETRERENMVMFGTICNNCNCTCSQVCSCPIVPSHQIGIGQREQNKLRAYEAGGSSGMSIVYDK